MKTVSPEAGSTKSVSGDYHKEYMCKISSHLIYRIERNRSGPKNKQRDGRTNEITDRLNNGKTVSLCLWLRTKHIWRVTSSYRMDSSSDGEQLACI